MWDAGRFVAQGQSGVDSYRGRFLSGYLGYETRLRWRIMSLKPRPVPTMFSPPWTRRTPSPVTLPIKILKRDKRLVNRCTVKETPRLRTENFHWLRPRFEWSDDRLFGDFVIFFLSLSLSLLRFKSRWWRIRWTEIFGNFLNSSRVVDRYFIRILKWRVFCGLIPTSWWYRKERSSLDF